MSLGWWVAIAAAAVINLGAGVWGFQAALPRLRYRHGFMEMQASTAVATTVPAGGALALGLTYRMFGSFGFSNVAISTAVVTTGVWNLGAKFGLPIAAVAQTIDIVHKRGWLLTGAVLASQFAVFVLVLFCVRAAGIPASAVSFLAVLLSFSIARLAGPSPSPRGAWAAWTPPSPAC
jgi:hypothetical protein